MDAAVLGNLWSWRLFFFTFSAAGFFFCQVTQLPPDKANAGCH
jgi:predicted MFS family arabinose efflux permease